MTSTAEAPAALTLPPAQPAQRGDWLPADAEPVDTGDFYARLAERGFQYGPAFQGLRAAWCSGPDVYAEIELGEVPAASAAGFAIHPALFDAALHAALVPQLAGEGGTMLPFALRGVRVQTAGSRSLRVRISPAGPNAVSLSAVDGDGRPVVSVRSLALRPVTAEQLRSAGQGGRLLRLEWQRFAVQPPDPADGRRWAFLGADPLAVAASLRAAGRPLTGYSSLGALDRALRGGEPVPDLVLVSCPGGAGSAEAVRAATQRALVLAQEWIKDDRLAGCTLLFLTHGAVATTPGQDLPDLAGAAVWGLVRSAQSEHPGRFALLDLDAIDTDLDAAATGSALAAAAAATQPQLALRGGGLLRPRLARAPAAGRSAPQRRWDPDGTVLITGGTGALGAMAARHLAARHGVRHLVLLSRRGPAAPGAARLVAELAGLGAEARVVAADVADPADLDRCLAQIPAQHPLRAVLHTAGVTADATVSALNPARFEPVFLPKVDGALNLHRATEALPDCALILYSSVSGLLGGAGQANYAAANAFLDALAIRRCAAGLPGVSLAWGLWAEGDGMVDSLAAADLQRIARLGLTALSAEEGLALLDAALERSDPLLVPLRLNDKLLASGAAGLPELLGELAARPAGGARAGEDTALLLRTVLDGMPEPDRDSAVVAFVCAQVAAVLGHDGPDAVQPGGSLGEAGFDSLTNLELSRRLSAASGLRLPATLTFDHPTPVALARHLRKLLAQ